MLLLLKSAKIKNGLDKPFRGEILSKDLLAIRAIELAQFHSQTQVISRGAKLRQRFKENCKILNEAYFSFAEAAKNKEFLAAGAEWLLDNFHVIDEQVRDIRRDLPRGYYQALPKLSSGAWKGYPRVYQIVCDFISHSDAVVDPEALTTFLNAYQSKTVLNIGEIWAIPIMLRLALVENLRRLAEAGIMHCEQRRCAEQICKEIIDVPSVVGAEMLMNLVNKVNANPKVMEYGATHFARRLRNKGAAAKLSLQWLNEQLIEKGIEYNEISRHEQQDQAADQLSVGNSVTALKTIGGYNWRSWFEHVSPVDEILNRDPAVIYPLSDFETHDLYRHRIEQLARLSSKSEVEVARQLVEYCSKIKEETPDSTDLRYQHVGYYLIDQGLWEFERYLGLQRTLRYRIRKKLAQNVNKLYFGFLSAIVFSGMTLAIIYSQQNQAHLLWYLILILVFIFPLSEFAIHFTDWIVTKLITPKPLPKLDFEQEIPANAATVVVVQAIIEDRESLERIVENLEIRSIGNQDKNIYFGILADLVDADTETLAGDLGILNRAKELVNDLNERYFPDLPGHFFILFRRRLWNSSENKFMGWERKRGKIMEFNHLLRGNKETSFAHFFGSIAELAKVNYVITLDSDTHLPPGVARKLIGTIDHPLNRAVFSSETNKVIRGFAIIQPRVGITLGSANSSRFAQIFSGHTGLDPYTRTVSNVYQDLFGEGSYIGKGIYHVDNFEKALAQRFPENALLSHDLIECLFARCGLASDIEVYDDFPQRYHAQARRQHRWIRGDWQLLPWLGRKIPDARGEKYPSPFNLLGYWKLLDNLRRSLVAPMLFLSLILLTCFAPGDVRVWFNGLIFILLFPVIIVFWRLLFDWPIGYSISSFLYSIITDFKKNFYLVFYSIVFLPHQAATSLSAIAITLYRLFIGKKSFLEWETAQAAEKRLSSSLGDFVKSMKQAYYLLIPLTIFNIYYAQEKTLYLLGLYLFWYLSPIFSWQVSKSEKSKQQELSAEEKEYIRGVAYSTWKYFDRYLKPEYNFLIPDNLQIVPQEFVAERTSPTNISLSMLSVVSAYDLGFTPLLDVITKLKEIFFTVSKMEKHHGHLLNWYSIGDLSPLNPRYISTVDNGNFIGHVMAVRQALLIFPFQQIISGRHIRHLTSLLKETKLLSAEKLDCFIPFSLGVKNLQELHDYLHFIAKLKNEELNQRLPKDIESLLDQHLVVYQLVSWVNEIGFLKSLGERKLLPKKFINIKQILSGRVSTISLLSKLVNRLDKLEKVIDISQLNEEEKKQFESLVVHLKTAQSFIAQYETDTKYIFEQIEILIKTTDFKFLFDQQKKLFTIGYNVDNGARDNSFYDLLASEARLASFIAIAKGDVPQSHWFLLGRSLTDSPGGKSLISWSGTMFEYLMPLLVTKSYNETLLSGTYQAVVKAQIAYGRRRGVPWGISESAYSGVDFHKTYQYKAFGIPGLGLKRGLVEDLVISPYSTAMAMVIEPREAYNNLQRLEESGVRGEYGFYEAVDYTPERLGADEKFHIVKSFLAHHQGMSLISINNLLNNNIFQKRFHSHPMVRACELLFQERFPTRIPVIQPHQAETLSLKEIESELKVESTEYIRNLHTSYPVTRLISNGKLSLIIDQVGSGHTFYKGDICLNRWRENGLLNNYGIYVYIKDLHSKKLWSATYHPTKVEPDSYEAIYSLDKVEFKRRDNDLMLHTELTISPEDDVEVRRISITNLSPKLRELEVSSFAEVALAPARADLAHPAFSKMFVRTEYLEDSSALVFTRLPRSEHDNEQFMMHMVTLPVVWAPTEYETAREKFIGRGHGPANPLALLKNEPLSGSVGTVLDPIFALKNKVEVLPGETIVLSFVTGIADTKDSLFHLIRKYRETQSVTRAFELAWTHSDVEIRHQHITRANVHNFQRLANALIFNIEKLRAPSELTKRSKLSQSGLWRFGVSGDEPIVLLIINERDQLKLCEELLFAHEYLRMRGLRFDLVILNEFQSGYLQELQQDLEFAIRTGYSRNFIDQRGGVFLRSINQLSEEEIALLQGTARIVFYGDKGSLGEQVDFLGKSSLELFKKQEIFVNNPKAEPPMEKQTGLEFENTFGGFCDQGKAYHLATSKNSIPPLPWVNVIANKDFGFLVSEKGAGFTWADNSRENRLSDWSNDPVLDPHTEVVYIRDPETTEYWNPTFGPVATENTVNVKHGFGYSSFQTAVNKIKSNLVLSVDKQDQLKWYYLELENTGQTAKKLELYFYFEWVLGVARQDSYRHLRTAFDEEQQFLYVNNPFNIDFSEQFVFIGSNKEINSYTTNRAEFVGFGRSLSTPIFFDNSKHKLKANKGAAINFSNNTAFGLDNCAVLKVALEIPPREVGHVQFYVAKAQNLDSARKKAQQYKLISSRNNSFQEVTNHWNALTEVVQVKTPSRKFDLMVNGWLIYQTLSCRIYARSGFFQSSGAMGFRDQLQDSMALLLSRPELTRAQILLHASRQFVEGDVQHWWHPPSGKGIRTKISDNYLWLPFAVTEYLKLTGDTSILEEQVSFLEGPLVEEGKHDIYFTPQILEKRASLYEHCVLALDRSLIVGEHGLPLMGCGDWNDGMNRVGEQGRGESVWLGWFLSYILKEFSEVLKDKGDDYRAERYKKFTELLVRAVEDNAWDGSWYRRAYFDDGSPLGSLQNAECQIDSLVQSWGIISGLANEERQKQSFDEMYKRLVDKENKLVKLLWPPFAESKPNPGYIQSYPKGLRENGGQYTHAAAWAVMAAAIRGDGDKAVEMFNIINPISHTETAAAVDRYKTEPYVTCGDVYANEQHLARGGWSWYTGSSGWLYRVAVEHIIGLKLKPTGFYLQPCIPKDWHEFSLVYKHNNGVTYRIKVLNPKGLSKAQSKISINGQVQEGDFVEFKSGDLQVDILVEMV